MHRHTALRRRCQSPHIFVVFWRRRRRPHLLLLSWYFINNHKLSFFLLLSFRFSLLLLLLLRWFSLRASLFATWFPIILWHWWNVTVASDEYDLVNCRINEQWAPNNDVNMTNTECATCAPSEKRWNGMERQRRSTNHEGHNEKKMKEKTQYNFFIFYTFRSNFVNVSERFSVASTKKFTFLMFTLLPSAKNVCRTAYRVLPVYVHRAYIQIAFYNMIMNTTNNGNSQQHSRHTMRRTIGNKYSSEFKGIELNADK